MTNSKAHNRVIKTMKRREFIARGAQAAAAIHFCRFFEVSDGSSQLLPVRDEIKEREVNLFTWLGKTSKK